MFLSVHSVVEAALQQAIDVWDSALPQHLSDVLKVGMLGSAIAVTVLLMALLYLY